MIYIIEGPDGAGKTTLVEQIKKSHMNARVLHFGAPATPEAADKYYEVYAKAISEKQPDEVLIFDRSWYSDMVYGPVMRGRLEMTQAHADMLSAMVVANGGGIVVYCTAPIKVLWARCTRRGEAYITTREKLVDIAKGYAEVMKHNVRFLPVVRYDTSVAVW